MRINSVINFNLNEFLKILFKRINSFAEVEDSLVSEEVLEYLKEEKDKEKLINLIKKASENTDNRLIKEEFSNGDSLYIK